MVCVGYFYDKFGGISSGDPDIIKVVRNATKICTEFINKDEHVDTSAALIAKLGDSEDDDVNAYVEIAKAINRIGNSFDYETLFDSAKKIVTNQSFLICYGWHVMNRVLKNYTVPKVEIMLPSK